MSQIFSQKFYDNLPDDPDDAFLLIHNEYRTALSNNKENPGRANTCLDAHSFLQLFVQHKWNKEFDPIDPNIDENQIYQLVNAQFANLNNEAASRIAARGKRHLSEKSYSTYSTYFEADPFVIHATDDQFHEIQALINKLRDLIKATDTLDNAHKRRILNRLERMQTEFNKTISDLDAIIAFFGNAALLLRTASDEILQAVTDLSKAVTIVIAVTYGLPAAQQTIFPLLPAPQVEDLEPHLPLIEAVAKEKDPATKVVPFDDKSPSKPKSKAKSNS